MLRSWYAVAELVVLLWLWPMTTTLLVSSRTSPPGKWWMYGSPQSALSVKEQCNDTEPLLQDAGDAASRLICPLANETVWEIQRSAYQAVEHCRSAFAKHRWNCPESSFPYLARRAFRETAFLQALMAASLTSGIARACHAGANSEACEDGCAAEHERRVARVEAERDNETVRASFDDVAVRTWLRRQCSDDIDKARRFSRDFTDRQEDPERKSGQFALYNYRVGREVFNSLVRQRCICYGVSGTCDLRTCYRQAPGIGELTKELYRRYGNALQTKKDFLPGSGHSQQQPRALTPRQAERTPRRGQLAYAKSSPAYCHAAPRRGLPGTIGRRCELDYTSQPGTCYSLCCGRGHESRRVEETRCDCRPVFCCRQVCDNCRAESKTVNTCSEF